MSKGGLYQTIVIEARLYFIAQIFSDRVLEIIVCSLKMFLRLRPHGYCHLYDKAEKKAAQFC